MEYFVCPWIRPLSLVSSDILPWDWSVNYKFSWIWSRVEPQINQTSCSHKKILNADHEINTYTDMSNIYEFHSAFYKAVFAYTILTFNTNFWSIYRFATFGWKSGDSKNRRKNSYTSWKISQHSSCINDIIRVYWAILNFCEIW